MISKACIVGAYQRKLEVLAQLPGIDLTVLVPPAWRDSRGESRLERIHTEGYTLQEIPIALNGHFHLHFYPTLSRHLSAHKPEIIHIDDEPYNLVTWQTMRAAMRLGARTCFFAWQNLYRRYPLPFRWIEQYNYRHAAHAIAGSQDAANVLRRKGYQGPVTVLPQFGIDPQRFQPIQKRQGQAIFVIGYAGGMVEEKGVDLLIQAAAGLSGDWQLRLIGEGVERAQLEQMARQFGIADRVHFLERIPSTDMPTFYQQLDVFVLPSRSRSHWTEQFGRVLVEAMACGVPVVGSESGEIPHVIGDTGLTFAEGDADALRGRLIELMTNPQARSALGAIGRQRVLDMYTHDHIAQATHQIYRQMMG